ncbi:MAG TPA: amidase [Fimbriimonadaceae bacterium]|nr:amidase [Fimbriimonadaceae bacterium]
MDLHGLTRKEFLTAALAAAASTALPFDLQEPASASEEITAEDLAAFEKVARFKLTEEQRKALLGSVRSQGQAFEALHKLPIDYSVEPPTVFRPFSLRPATGKPGSSVTAEAVPKSLKRPRSEEDLAFMSVTELGHLLRTRQITSSELTEMYLSRLRTHGEKLLSVVTLTPERAREAARRADREIAAGRYRGPLHGIPCGIKDLFAMRGYPTTWGSEPHKDQVFDYDAALVERLDAAGAVIVAKLSMGALAQGDVWFRGRTKTPWNPAQDSSGSSAGSGAAVAAGLVGFAIGTETLGSIMSPSLQSRVSGLRPTYGRVSRYGAMAVSWTLDKIGPMCRTIEDCAVVFAAIHGADPRDPSTVGRPFHYRPKPDLAKLKIGFLAGRDESLQDTSRLDKDDYLKALVKLGAKPRPVRFSAPPQGMSLVLGVEAAAAFDEFTRSERIELLKNSAWPMTYRANRYVSAVDYLTAQRARSIFMRTFEEEFGDFDLFVAPGISSPTLLSTNFTGHPQVLVPNGEDEKGNPKGVSVTGRLYGEGLLCAVAAMLQRELGHVGRRPDLSKL